MYIYSQGHVVDSEKPLVYTRLVFSLHTPISRFSIPDKHNITHFISSIYTQVRRRVQETTRQAAVPSAERTLLRAPEAL